MLHNGENTTPPLAETGLEQMNVSGEETSASYPSVEPNTIESCGLTPITPVPVTANLQPSPEIALKFVRNAFPSGRVTLTAILSDEANRPPEWQNKKGKTVTRTLCSEEEIISWLNRAPAHKLNLYFTANALAGEHRKKPEKTDIKAARFLYCDCDPRAGEDLEAEQSRILTEIRNLELPPTVVIFSGGGYQCLWLLQPEVPINTPEDILAVENRNRWLGAKFLAADNTQNIDRLLRLPGSVNYPDAGKQKKGRQAALAYVVEELTDWSRTYRLEDFLEETPPKPSIKSRIAQVTTLPDLVSLEPAALESLAELEKWGISDALRDLIATGKAPHHPSRSETLYPAVCGLARCGVPDAVILGILLDSRFKISESVLECGHKALEYAKRQVERARLLVNRDIIVRDGSLNAILDKAEATLLAEEAPLYQRGEMLVRTVYLEGGGIHEGISRSAGTTILTEVTPKWLTQQMARAGNWLKQRKEGEYVPTDPKESYAQHLLSRKGEWPYRKLRAVIHTPTLRADGSILQTEGYDEASQLLYAPGGMTFPPIPEYPTREEAQAALATLAAPFAEFPFVSEAARSVILAAVLTGLIRPSLRSAPMFCVDAPTAGTGKSLLAELVGLVVTGNVPAMMSQGKNEEEDEKRLSTVLRGGDPVIVIDNCEGEIRGDFLCSMLTQETVQARILGKSEMVKLPCSSIVLATGNNLAVVGDMCRRVLICRIDARHERPDTRQFTIDARQLVRQQRPALVAAGLTILRAYIAAGKPRPLRKIGSFEEWNIVREALGWAGAGDPYETLQLALEHDPRKNELRDLLAAWHDCYGSAPKTLADISNERDDACVWKGSNGKPPTEQAAKLDHLYRLLVEQGGKPTFNSKSIGHRLRTYLGSIVGGMTLRQVERSQGAKWSVVRIEDVAGNSGWETDATGEV